jgi:hypothetical protein
MELYDVAASALLTRTRQPAPHAHVRARVIDAALNADHSLLVVVLQVPAAPDDDTSVPYMRFQAVSLATWKAELPFIDIADWSKGTAAPAWCIRCGHSPPPPAALLQGSESFTGPKNAGICRHSRVSHDFAPRRAGLRCQRLAQTTSSSPSAATSSAPTA